jgi:hypothetical protein
MGLSAVASDLQICQEYLERKIIELKLKLEKVSDKLA